MDQTTHSSTRFTSLFTTKTTRARLAAASTAALASLAMIPAADAEPCADGRCESTAAVHVAHENKLFEPINLDTGWFPDDWDVQVRVKTRARGETMIDMNADLAAKWPAIAATLPGEADGGTLDMGYGLEVIPLLRIDVDIPFYGDFKWEGEIPTSDTLPTDLLMDGMTAFQPYAFGDPATVSGSTDRVLVVGYELDDSIIDIPGITGVLGIEVQATLTANYKTDSVSVDGAILNDNSVSVSLGAAGAEGYGSVLDVAVQPAGTIEYTLSLSVFPQFRVELLGFTIGELDLAEWSFDVWDDASEIVFDEQIASLPLPDLSPESSGLSLQEDGSGALKITNTGQRELVLTVNEIAQGLSAESIRIAPGEIGALSVTTGAEALGAFRAGTIAFATNDPDTPIFLLDVAADGVPLPGDDQSGGCFVGSASGTGGAGSLFLIVGLALCGLRWPIRRSRA